MIEQETSTPPEFISIGIIENPVEADIVSDILRQEGIPHELRSYHDTAYDGLFQAQLGWGELRAPDAFKEKIREILRDIRQEDLSGLAAPPE